MSNRRTLVIVAVVLTCGLLTALVAALVIRVFYRRSNLPVHTQHELLTALNETQPPPGAKAVHDDTVMLRGSHALVGRDYSFNGTYEDIRKHYDKELRSKGWYFVEERKLKNWSQDFGERELNYCKQGIWANVFYNGSLATQRDSLYHVNVSSGLNRCPE